MTADKDESADSFTKTGAFIVLKILYSKKMSRLTEKYPESFR